MRNTATASLPTKPMTPATATAPSKAIAWGWMSRSTAWWPATTALDRMMATIAIPARSPAQPVGEAVGGLAAREHEGDPQRHRGDRVADVVDGVGQEGHAARGQDDEQ